MYTLEFTNPSKKDLENIDKANKIFIIDRLKEFERLFNDDYEKALMQKGIIKKLKGKKETIYRLKLRTYRVVYKKYEDKLIILVLHVSTHDECYV